MPTMWIRKFKCKAYLGPQGAHSLVGETGWWTVIPPHDGGWIWGNIVPAMDLWPWDWAGYAHSARMTGTPLENAWGQHCWPQRAHSHGIAVPTAGENGHWPTDPCDYTWHLSREAGPSVSEQPSCDGGIFRWNIGDTTIAQVASFLAGGNWADNSDSDLLAVLRQRASEIFQGRKTQQVGLLPWPGWFWIRGSLLTLCCLPKGVPVCPLASTSCWIWIDPAVS